MEEKLTELLLSENANEDFTAAYQGDPAFRDWLNGLIPEVKQCFIQGQNSPWHIYGVMEHILHSVEAMNAQTLHLTGNERKLLAYTMFFHDLGKPECVKVKEVNGIKKDTFRFHNLASERIAKRVLPSLNFSGREREIITVLVKEHDIFMYLSEELEKDGKTEPTAEYLKEYIDGLSACGDGKRIFGYLIMVGLADNRAQNPEMNGKSLAFIKRLARLSETLQ